MSSEDPKPWTKEAVYDEQISPLMVQIIAICKEHQIPLVAQFQYAHDEENGPAFVTTALPFEGVACEQIVDLARRMRPAPPVVLAETLETLPGGAQRLSIRRVQ